MSYLNIITLAEAKNYLRVDDSLTADDAQITSMIKSSLSYIERATNHIAFARSKSYLFEDCEVRVYDYPINSLTSPTDAESDDNGLYVTYTTDNSDNTTLTLNVGYSNPADFPSELKDAALQMIKYYYFEAETDQANKGNLPMWLKDTINQYKRFIF